MVYTIRVVESILRGCDVEVEAPTEDVALERASDMWSNNLLDNQMVDSDNGPDIERIYVSEPPV